MLCKCEREQHENKVQFCIKLIVDGKNHIKANINNARVAHVTQKHIDENWNALLGYAWRLDRPGTNFYCRSCYPLDNRGSWKEPKSTSYVYEGRTKFSSMMKIEGFGWKTKVYETALVNPKAKHHSQAVSAWKRFFNEPTPTL